MVQSSISKYNHDLPYSIFEPTIRRVLHILLAAWGRASSSQYIETMQSSSYKFIFVPQNQIGSSDHRQHICALLLYIVDHIQIFVAMKTFLYTGSHVVVSIRHNFVWNHKRCRFPVFRIFAREKINAIMKNVSEKQFFNKYLNT